MLNNKHQKLFDYPELVSSINFNIDPCEDFFEFVCSGYYYQSEIPDDKIDKTQFSDIVNEIEERIQSLIL